MDCLKSLYSTCLLAYTYTTVMHGHLQPLTNALRVHSCENLTYISRKFTDKKPNQVQTKLKLTPDIRKLCKLVYVGSQELSDYSIDDICNNAVAQIE